MNIKNQNLIVSSTEHTILSDKGKELSMQKDLNRFFLINLYSNEIFKRKDNNLRLLMSCSDIARTISVNETFL